MSGHLGVPVIVLYVIIGHNDNSLPIFYIFSERFLVMGSQNIYCAVGI